tara:strand:- start:3691 stop:4944 length:1254 start_codon:yes stop_codon:yes gene_type:complete
MKNIKIKSWGNIFEKNVELLEAPNRGGKYIPVGNQNSLSDSNIPIGSKALKLNSSEYFDDLNNTEINSFVTIGQYVENNKKLLYGIPGTPNVTFGGAIAADVHGKDAHWGKNFAANIESIKLKLSSNRVLDISRDSESDIFGATIGGFGLTGQIISARLKPNDIKYSEFFKTSIKKGAGISDLIDEIRLIDNNYFLAVIDLVNKHDKWIIKRSSPVVVENIKPLAIKSKKKETSIYLPFVGGNFLYSLNLLQALYPHMQRGGVHHYSDTLYPQGGIRDPRIFCKNKKIVEIQFSIPMKEINNIEKIFEIIRRHFNPVTCSLKILSKREKLNNLSFYQEGVGINFDIPFNKVDLKIVEKIYALLIAIGGKVNLSKDSLLNEKQFKEMYPEFEQWIKVVKKVDSNDNFQSSLSKRLGIK